MSTVIKRPSGWYGIARYKDENGKRHQKGAGTFKLKRDAQRAADDLERELQARNVELSELSFADYFQRWYEIFKEQGKARQTKNRYKNNAKVIRRYFGDKKLTEIRASEYQQFINWYGADHAPDTVTKLNSHARNCVRAAIGDDVITKDFTLNVQLVSNKDKKLKVEYLSMKDTQLLESIIIGRLNPHFTSCYMILMAIYTGMRKEEIQALTWNDIDFTHGIITINKAWDDVDKEFKDTKTKTSNRRIQVNRKLLDHLAELRQNDSTMVFSNVWGTIPTSTALNKELRSALNECGINKPGFHFHSLRHVHVALLLSKSIPIQVISKRLGHSNVATTMNIYAYLIDEFKARNEEKIINGLSELFQ
ncbi:tyrosine-type recombinase/integrase [Limosilactobacillus fermentum]|uniref:tyrosine-type recombinase/integrase n=1 Tax=Limosilactobacillus fermentum TaxID=1613 RepID=UPI003D774350